MKGSDLNRRVLVWLTRKPCACTRTPDDRYVASLCWRHGLLDWLDGHLMLVTNYGGYYRDGYLQWRPWRWTTDGWLKTARERGLLRRGPVLGSASF